MALEIGKTAERREFRSVGIGFLGVLLLVAAGYLAYALLGNRQPESTTTPEVYHYEISQSVDSDVEYENSSFFPNGPGPFNKAYVTDITKNVLNTFHYKFKASKAIDLSYNYLVVAEVHARYGINGDKEKASNVWSRTFQLVEPVQMNETTDSISLNPSTEMPLIEYKKLITDLQAAFTLPVNSEVVLTFRVQVKGNVGGTDFNDVKVSTVTVPLDQQLYTLAVAFEKQSENDVVPQKLQEEGNVAERIKTYAAIALAVLGLAALVYGLRKQIFKTPYQRELDKIYRYHDGIIIKASKPADLSNKNVVPVQSFGDMLNLEEELKIPIVASPVGAEATRFMIVRDDITYVYTLGKLLLTDDPLASVEPNTPPEHKPEATPAHSVQKPHRPGHHRKVQ